MVPVTMSLGPTAGVSAGGEARFSVSPGVATSGGTAAVSVISGKISGWLGRNASAAQPDSMAAKRDSNTM
jgi:hypothetical protein